MTPFDFIKSINETKQNLIVDDITEKEYNPYIVNKGLSYFIDTILYANEMNMYPGLDKKLQYDYLINTIKSKKRFSKWHKKNDDELTDVIIKYYGYTIQKVKSILNVLSEEQKKIILKKLKEE